MALEIYHNIGFCFYNHFPLTLTLASLDNLPNRLSAPKPMSQTLLFEEMQTDIATCVSLLQSATSCGGWFQQDCIDLFLQILKVICWKNTRCYRGFRQKWNDHHWNSNNSAISLAPACLYQLLLQLAQSIISFLRCQTQHNPAGLFWNLKLFTRLAARRGVEATRVEHLLLCARGASAVSFHTGEGTRGALL